MTTAPKLPAAADANLAIVQAKNDANRKTARAISDGAITTAVSLAYLPSLDQEGASKALAEYAHDQALAVAAGDLSSLERMLLTQAVSLQSMFTDLSMRARRQSNREWFTAQTTLALKAAAASRQAITALAELRTPRTAVFARQANVTTGPQQVNNGMPSADATVDSPRARGKSRKVAKQTTGGAT